MDMERIPTRGQLERQLSQETQALYRSLFGHLPQKVVCHIFADKIAIIAEDTVTAIERMLQNNSQSQLASDIRSAIGEAFAVQLRQKITEVMDLPVIDLICDSGLDSGYLGAIAFLEKAPDTRPAKKERYQNKSVFLKEECVISQQGIA